MRSPIGAIRSDPELRGFFRALMQEAYAVGRAKGVALAPDFIEGRMKFLDTIEPGMKASMAHDLERGNRIELDWLAGKVRSLGRAATTSRRRRATRSIPCSSCTAWAAVPEPAGTVGCTPATRRQPADHNRDGACWHVATARLRSCGQPASRRRPPGLSKNSPAKTLKMPEQLAPIRPDAAWRHQMLVKEPIGNGPVDGAVRNWQALSLRATR